MTSTIDLPDGGQATFIDDPAQITERRRRPASILQTQLGRKLPLIQRATRLIVDGDVVEEHDPAETKDGKPIHDGGDFELTEKDLDKLNRLNDALAWSLLTSWTLDRPLPASPDEMLDLPPKVYEAIRAEAARIFVEHAAADTGFTVAAVEDQASPTGA